ncbi:MAG: cupin domain-containing protein, partial [Eubacterium sp.]
FTGNIEIYADGQSFVVEKGESIRFRADTPHSYKNIGDESAELHMILFNP